MNEKRDGPYEKGDIGVPNEGVEDTQKRVYNGVTPKGTGGSKFTVEEGIWKGHEERRKGRSKRRCRG